MPAKLVEKAAQVDLIRILDELAKPSSRHVA
jgi:hypothetical protein